MTKKIITSIAKTDTYKSLSTFSSVKEMNLALQHYQIKFDAELTKTEKTVLITLSHYSCIYPGVSFLRKRKIGELVGKSRRTIIRVCNRLETLGIIRQYNLKRENDLLQTVNAIVILPIDNDTEPPITQHVTPAPADFVTPKSLIILKQKKEIKNTYIPKTPYDKFKERAACFISNKKLIQTLYGIYRAQTVPLKTSFNSEETLNSGLQSLKIVLQATKQKTIRNLPGYFNGTLKKLLKELYFSTLHELGWNEKTASTPIGIPAVTNLSYTLENYISQ